MPASFYVVVKGSRDEFDIACVAVDALAYVVLSGVLANADESVPKQGASPKPKLSNFDKSS